MKVRRGSYVFICLAAGILFAGSLTNAQSAASLPASQIPDLVVPTNGINLGNTSFYDGFSTLNPGLTVLEYVRENHFTSITGTNGSASSKFSYPRIDVLTSVTQFSAVAPISLDGNALGADVLLPVTHINSRFGSSGQQLTDNGTALGDLTFGPFVQFKPIMYGGRPIASFRIAFDAIAPTGGFDKNRDLNQSSGYWSLNPFVAWTILPGKGWEISGRAQYLYNFKTSNIPNPPSIPGFVFNDGRAGQLFYSNFSASYEAAKGLSLGVNGFFVQQLNNDEINGITLPYTRRSAVYIGPGIHFDRLPGWGLNLNLYVPVSTHNYSTGPQFNLQFIKPLVL